jgi:hypothetical protein
LPLIPTLLPPGPTPSAFLATSVCLPGCCFPRVCTSCCFLTVDPQHLLSTCSMLGPRPGSGATSGSKAGEAWASLCVCPQGSEISSKQHTYQYVQPLKPPHSLNSDVLPAPPAAPPPSPPVSATLTFLSVPGPVTTAAGQPFHRGSRGKHRAYLVPLFLSSLSCWPGLGTAVEPSLSLLAFHTHRDLEIP